MTKRLPYIVALLLLVNACSPETVSPPVELTRVSVEHEHFRDALGRYVYLNGVNVSGTSKVPVTTVPVSYVGRPFPEAELDSWFARLKADGFNSIRLLTVWEAINHEAPDKYDTEYLDYFETVVRKANEHGIYVLINFHENLFSRHLYAQFNDHPELGEPGSLEAMLGSLFPAKDPETGELYYDSRVEGDGAPRWAVEACAPEKDLDNPSYGMIRLLGSLGKPGALNKVIAAFTALLSGGDMGDSEELIQFLATKYLELTQAKLLPFDINQTTDMLPLTLWAINSFLSSDVEKCYAAFFAGNDVFPTRMVNGKPIQQYLQDGHTGAWLQVVDRVKDYPNVIGYDLMNEPTGVFLILSLLSAYVSAGFDNTAAYEFITDLAGVEIGDALYNIIDAVELLPSVPLELTQETFETDYRQPLEEMLRTELGPVMTVLLDQLPDDPKSEPYATLVADSMEDAKASVATKAKTILKPLSDEQEAEIQAELASWTQTILSDSIDFAHQAVSSLQADGLDTDSAVLMAKVEAKEQAFRTTLSLVDDTLQTVRHDALLAYWDTIKEKWGLADMDLFAVLGLNLNLDRKYLMAYYTKLSEAIQAADPDAVVWWGDALGLGVLGDGSGLPMTNSTMYKPDSVKSMVSAYHWYAGVIYPLGLFQVPPQTFAPQEWEERNFLPDMSAKYEKTSNTFGRVPVVFTEFGTYFNFNWNLKDLDSILDNVKKDNYAVSAEILNDYYEALESLFGHRMVWCMSGDNDYQKGDLWNHEDFSIYGPDQKPRAELAWMRPVPWSLAGEPIQMHFYSDYAYLDPDKAKPEEWQKREFYVSYEGKESSAPSEIYIPSRQYPDGFYVWLSDGWAVYQPASQVLYHYPTNDSPDAVHEITVRPPVSGRPLGNWAYFFKGTDHLTGPGAEK